MKDLFLVDRSGVSIFVEEVSVVVRSPYLCVCFLLNIVLRSVIWIYEASSMLITKALAEPSFSLTIPAFLIQISNFVGKKLIFLA